MKQNNIQAFIEDLNQDLLEQTENQLDLRNCMSFDESVLESSFSMPDIEHCWISDETRKDLLELKKNAKDDPVVMVSLKKLLNREILYIGSECNKLGVININEEYTLINDKLSDPYISLSKVKCPSISNIISKWDEIKPSIIFISCHGDKLGLFLEDNNGKCLHYSNLKFINFFKKRSNYTDCVILSSCESLNLGQSIFNEGKKVICINNKVDIGTATAFNHHFFEYLNNHSLESSGVYKDAFDYSMEIINFEGLKDCFSFEFIDANKIG